MFAEMKRFMKKSNLAFIVLIIFLVISMAGISAYTWIAQDHPQERKHASADDSHKPRKNEMAKQEKPSEDTTDDAALLNTFVNRFRKNGYVSLPDPSSVGSDTTPSDVPAEHNKPQTPDVPQPAPEPELSFADQMMIARANAAGGLYEAISRDPDHRETYVNLFQSLLGTKNPNPTIDEQVAIVQSYNDLIVYGARNPYELSFMIQTSDELFGQIHDFDNPRIRVARARCGASLYEAITRNVGLKDMLTSAFRYLLKEKTDHPSIEEQAAVVESYAALFDGYGRNPATAPALTQAAHDLFPTVTALDSPLVRTARAKAGGSLYLAWARLAPYPEYREYANAMVPLFYSLTGEKKDHPSVAEQTAIVESYGLLFQGYTYLHSMMPEQDAEAMQTKWIQMRNELFPAVDLNLDAVRVARAETMNDLYMQAARFHDYDTLPPLFKRLLGEKSAHPSQNEQAAIAESYNGLLSAYTRAPDDKDLLLQIGNELVGLIDDWSGDTLRIARADLGATLYTNIARQPDVFLDVLFNSLTGSKSAQPTIEEQAAIARNYDMLIQSWLRIPELKDVLLQTAHEQFGDLSDKQAPPIQLAKAKVCSAMLAGLAFHGSDSDFHEFENQAVALYHQLLD